MSSRKKAQATDKKSGVAGLPAQQTKQESKNSALSAQAAAENSGQEDLHEIRLAKLMQLLETGYNPYALSFEKKNVCRDLIVAGENEELALGGRVKSKRSMGKACFLDIEDDSGRCQIYANRTGLAEKYDLFEDLDLGDIIGVTGQKFITKTGQPSLRAGDFVLLSKCLQPPPVVKESEGRVHDAFSDKELRYRMRYVDLMANPQVRDVFLLRSKLIQKIRDFLNERGFIEVETPMMQTVPGGAVAKPFVTHHNALGIDLFLRIAPELYLKRLLVGGFSRVYEINRNFRNEGISYKHNPEFTMLELYEAFGNMNSMMNLCEELITGLVQYACKGMKIIFENDELDFSPPWERLPYLMAIEKYSGIVIHTSAKLDELKGQARRAGLKVEDIERCDSIWRLAELLFDEKVEKNLIQPVFITDFPAALSPLSKRNPANPEFVERFEPYAAAREIGNAFSELNDPLDQKERFLEQVRQRESGAGEGGYMDHDYIRALEYGMPPAGGMGIGIDRLVMLLTNQHSIRDTILFPLMRPEQS